MAHFIVMACEFLVVVAFCYGFASLCGGLTLFFISVFWEAHDATIRFMFKLWLGSVPVAFALWSLAALTQPFNMEKGFSDPDVVTVLAIILPIFVFLSILVGGIFREYWRPKPRKPKKVASSPPPKLEGGDTRRLSTGELPVVINEKAKR